MKKILLSGSTGFVGSNLIKSLEKSGYEVYKLTLVNSGLKNEICWKPEASLIEKEKIPKNISAVINLAGENISEGRWTENKKNEILKSRICSTRFLHDIIRESKNSPDVWINASATGYYGDSKDKINTEESPEGKSFLSNVCKKWENEALKTEDVAKRVIILRFGVILDKNGGALKKMLPIFELGLGGKLGTGNQYFPWISLQDVINIIEFFLLNNLSGVFNTVSPDIVTNKEFTKSLASSLKRPAILPVPEKVLKLLFGQMAEETLLMSTKASSEKLKSEGYKFSCPLLKEFFELTFNN